MNDSLTLTTAQRDRAVGVLMASAAGDALGAGYEFTTPDPDLVPGMIGGGLGGFNPGEWTDDTAQAMAIARVAATGADLRSEDALTAIAQGFADWYRGGPADVGAQTAQVLGPSGRNPTGTQMAATAKAFHERMGRSAGNGALMRQAPVSIAYLHDPVALVEASRKVAALTHFEQVGQDACVVWGLITRHAVLTGELPTFADIESHVPEADYWRGVLLEAETQPPNTFSVNGWAVGALQAAWSAIIHTPSTPAETHKPDLAEALGTVIRIGHDTDTTAAIAGQVLGGLWGASSVPAAWRMVLHGWPMSTARDLDELGMLIANGGKPLVYGWPVTDTVDYRSFGPASIEPHPFDMGLLIGSAPALDDLPDDVDAVVSLCLVGRRQVPRGVQSVTFRLIDSPDPAENPNLDFVIVDAARTVQRLRAPGKRVFLHCVRAESRTPTVAIAYSLLDGMSLEQAQAGVLAALPNAHPNRAFVAALERIAAGLETGS